MRKKVIKLLGIIAIITMLISTKVNAFTLDTTERIYTIYDYFVPYYYEGEEKTKYLMLEYKSNVFYTFNRNHDTVTSYMTNQETYINPVFERILENGFPAKTYRELNVDNQVDAFLATQEAIYIILENRDINQYVAEDEEGRKILDSTKQILEKAKKAYVTLKEVDSEWETDENDENFMYKTYKINLSEEVKNASIRLEGATNCKVYTIENQQITTIKDGDMIKILVPKGMNQVFQAILSYEKQGVNLYKCYNSSMPNTKYLIGEQENGSREASFDIKFENLATITVSNYDNETKNAVQGSTFCVLNKEQEIVKENLITDEEGKVQTFLEKGEYYLKQIGVPTPYSLASHLTKFTVKDKEKVSLNIYNSEMEREETTQNETQINMTQENKQIVENHVTDVTNIHATNIEKEIIYQTNENNFKNVNYFVNTIHQKNINNIVKENTYQNEIWKEIITNKVIEGENEKYNMTRDDYITYIDYIKMSSMEVPNLPAALKQ